MIRNKTMRRPHKPIVLSERSKIALCEAASAAWRLAGPRASRVRFRWRGKAYTSDLWLCGARIHDSHGVNITGFYSEKPGFGGPIGPRLDKPQRQSAA